MVYLKTFTEFWNSNSAFNCDLSFISLFGFILIQSSSNSSRPATLKSVTEVSFSFLTKIVINWPIFLLHLHQVQLFNKHSLTSSKYFYDSSLLSMYIQKGSHFKTGLWVGKEKVTSDTYFFQGFEISFTVKNLEEFQ